MARAPAPPASIRCFCRSGKTASASAPGANLSDSVACFEATHGTAPKYAGKDYVNPGSEILSAEIMLRHMGWKKAADSIISAMEGATQVSCSGFG